MIIFMCKDSFYIAVTNRSLAKKVTEDAKQNLLLTLPYVCECGPKAIILREKDLKQEEYFSLAKEAIQICKGYEIPLILHTYVEVARALKWDMIHLPLSLLKEYSGKLEDFSVVGASIHSVNEAKEAMKLGATYVTAGHVFATDCKKGVPPRGTEFLKEVCQCVSLPVYAIGGIQKTKELEALLKSCGAAGGCIMSGYMKGKSL